MRIPQAFRLDNYIDKYSSISNNLMHSSVHPWWLFEWIEIDATILVEGIAPANAHHIFKWVLTHYFDAYFLDLEFQIIAIHKSISLIQMQQTNGLNNRALTVNPNALITLLLKIRMSKILSCVTRLIQNYAFIAL